MDITVNQMMKIEENSHALGVHKKLMMENAGSSIAKFLVMRFKDLTSKHILIFVGLGNNGGDALVAARHLVGYGAKVDVVFLGNEPMKKLESIENFEIVKKMKSIHLFYNCNDLESNKYDILIDGILGTGIKGDIVEPYLSAVQFINSSNSFVVSIDVPTGIDPDTGNVSNVFTRANVTITFHLTKIGIKKQNFCGKIYVEKIGIPPEAEEGVL
ncbi:MAG: NAD(P)H-hydrate epimerase [Thaumarchaeota archaeon]|nr:NAD(P)H-hydrate epimerase [Nitrososphaerota archaeon]MCY3976150.1 NAD(P)H-hydrate epimerase [Nitrososphaerota archaeon]